MNVHIAVYLLEEATQILQRYGAETRIFNPSGLPLPDDNADATHEKVAELRDIISWSEGMVWCSPERHGAMTGIMKAQIDWIPLSIGSVRPTQGKTLAGDASVFWSVHKASTQLTSYAYLVVDEMPNHTKSVFCAKSLSAI